MSFVLLWVSCTVFCTLDEVMDSLVFLMPVDVQYHLCIVRLDVYRSLCNVGFCLFIFVLFLNSK